MLKLVFGIFGKDDFDGYGIHLSIGSFPLVAFKFTEVNLIFCLLGIGFGIWYDSGEE